MFHKNQEYDKRKKSTINVQGTEIPTLTQKENDYISLTDMVKNFDGGSSLIEQWLKNKDTVFFLGFGNKLIIPILISPNSRELKNYENEKY